jgi:MFS family permease
MQLHHSPPESPGPADETSLAYPGWRVAAACFVMAVFCWGFGFYGHGVYLAELQKIHGWPNSLISGASTVYYLCSAALLTFVADAMTRFGPRAVVLGGTACFAVSGSLLPFITQPWQLYADYLLMAVGWATMSIAGIVTILGMWFDSRRGLAISLALNGASFGGILLVPALAAGSAHYGFAPSMLTAVAAMIIVLVPFAIFVISRPPSALGRPSAGAAAEASVPAATTRGRALCDPAFWTVVGPFSLGMLAQVGFLVHQIAFLQPQIGSTRTALAVGITTTMAVIGRLTLGSVMHRLDNRKASALSLLAQAIAVSLMLVASGSAALLLLCAIFGFSVGNLITFPSLIVQREFAARDFALIIGLSTSITQLAYSCGPVVVGLLRDLTGGYQVPMMACAALFGLAALGILMRVPSSSS